jgi:hypothetical protein
MPLAPWSTPCPLLISSEILKVCSKFIIFQHTLFFKKKQKGNTKLDLDGPLFDTFAPAAFDQASAAPLSMPSFSMFTRTMHQPMDQSNVIGSRQRRAASLFFPPTQQIGNNVPGRFAKFF